jgi:hypothetical protein
MINIIHKLIGKPKGSPRGGEVGPGLFGDVANLAIRALG